MSLRRLHTVFRHLLPSKAETAYFQTYQASAYVHHQTGKLPSLTAEPRVALYDAKVKILLKDFPSNEKVTLHGQFIQEGRKKKVIFASCGHYVTDDSGKVSVWDQPSKGGTYSGLEPMGIVWSLQPAPGEPRHTRMAINFTDRPTIIHLQTYQGHLELEDIYQSTSQPTILASVQIERWFRSPDVTRIEVHAGNVRGALFLPPGKGPFQGVIDLFGSAGGVIEYRAALLASNGFAALSLPYFRYKDLKDNLGDVTFDYFEEAVNWFSSHPFVIPNGIGIVAVSKGVEFAYLMSAYCEQVKSVVAINGHPYFGLNDLYYKGKKLCHGSPFDMSLIGKTEEGMIVGHAVPYENNLIPAWQGNAKHLLLISEDDFQVEIENYRLMIDACPTEKKCNFEVVRYPGAGHLLEPPYTALCRSAINPTFGFLMLFGGKRKEHAHAQEDSWQRILNHLRKNIPTA